MPQKPRLALVSTYSHPTRDSIERMMRESFPDFEIDNVSVMEVMKRHRSWRLPNAWYIATEQRRGLLRGQLTFREAYFRTTYAFRKLHQAMRQLIIPGRHAFSFQMQSLYDTSVPGVPHFVYTDHTHLSNLHYPDFEPSELRSPRWIELERTIYENAAAVLTRSTDIARDLVGLYQIAAEKIECVYAGSNVDIAATPMPDNANYTNQRILFVGSDWERKGGPELVTAFRQLLEHHPGAQLLIAGASPSLDLPNCTVLGHVPSEQLAQHYRQAAIFCLPTKLEPFGIAFVEAMMHRLPIVATRVGAVPDMVENGFNGFLTDPGDAQSLVPALGALLSDPAQCELMGRHSYERAVERYDWARVGARIRARVLRTLGDRSVAFSAPIASRAQI